MIPVVTIDALGGHVGGEVCLRGWLEGRRSGGKLLFLQVRDGTGRCQCVVEAVADAAFRAAERLTQESACRVAGLVRADPRAPGGFELAVSAVEIVHLAEPYPIARKAHGVDFLMDHRHLWLRSRRQTILLRIRHTLERAIRDFFDSRGFTLVDTPILIQGAAEGAGTLFPVQYYEETAYLAQTGQLHLECACMALGKVYCFGPTFRAEKSKTRRHLSEFWMVEPEVAHADLEAVMALAEALVSDLVARVLAAHAADLEALGRDLAPLRAVRPPFPRLTYTQAVERLRDPETLARLERALDADRQTLERDRQALRDLETQRAAARQGWQQAALDDRIAEQRERLRELEQDLAARPEHLAKARAFAWGQDLGGSDETLLSSQFDRPVLVTRYPRAVKAFYMKADPADPRLVLNMDMLAPEGYGEIIGGSQREEQLDRLQERMHAEGLDPAGYGWYLDLRRYGSVPHGGFGLGLERTLAWICGLKHVRETIPFPRLLGRLAP